ncbi:MAG: hypothetical protein HQK53_04365 [Oligoflexia bacterium]|nr:hypothetical protein [Oligoflexia bacterium]
MLKFKTLLALGSFVAIFMFQVLSAGVAVASSAQPTQDQVLRNISLEISGKLGSLNLLAVNPQFRGINADKIFKVISQLDIFVSLGSLRNLHAFYQKAEIVSNQIWSQLVDQMVVSEAMIDQDLDQGEKLQKMAINYINEILVNIALDSNVVSREVAAEYQLLIQS